MSEDLTQRRNSCLHSLPNSPASCIIALALILGSLPAVAQTAPTPRLLTILKSTIYETTPWAVTDILPGGRNTPFTGIPMPAMSGADSVALILKYLFTVHGSFNEGRAGWGMKTSRGIGGGF